MSDIKQDLREVRDEVLATKEQLVSYKDSCGKLQEELQVCDTLVLYTSYEIISNVCESDHVYLSRKKM